MHVPEGIFSSNTIVNLDINKFISTKHDNYSNITYTYKQNIMEKTVAT